MPSIVLRPSSISTFASIAPLPISPVMGGRTLYVASTHTRSPEHPSWYRISNRVATLTAYVLECNACTDFATLQLASIRMGRGLPGPCRCHADPVVAFRSVEYYSARRDLCGGRGAILVGAASKAADLGGERPLPSIAVQRV
jgi:hypothetical protein